MESPEEDQSTDPIVVSKVIASSGVSSVPGEVKEKEEQALGAGPAVAQKLTLPHCPGSVERSRKRIPLSDALENCCVMLNLRGGQSERSYFS